MRDIKVALIPKCDICKKENAGVIDVPVAGIGTSWANMCEECAKEPLEYPGAYAIATKKILQIPAKPVDSAKILRAKELTSLEAMMGDEDREVECPECGEIRTVEMDADYIFVCSGCGKKVRCHSLI